MADRCGAAFTGGQGDGAGAAPASELGLAGEAERIADFDDEGRRGDGADAGLVAQGGAVLVEQTVQLALQPADLGERLAVVVDGGLQPRQAVAAGGC